jgi:hypothetical protein
MSSADPAAKLEDQLIDDPFAPELDEALLVAADYMQSRGNVRGELIVHERALAGARSRAERMLRRAELEGWLDRHESLVFGSLAWLRTRPSTLRYELRGGHLRGLFVDTRRALQRSPALDITTLVHTIVGARAARKLTWLQLRVRTDEQCTPALAAIEQAGRALPLEWLVISPTTRPLDHQTRGHAVDLRKRFPHLWLVTRFARLAPLLDPELGDDVTAHELGEFAGAPMNQELRIRIGRGLGSGREQTTRVACELLAGLGPSAAVFVPTLDLLLRPRVSHAAAWILPMLPQCGPWVMALERRVASIVGDSRRYPFALGRLAHACLHELRAKHGNVQIDTGP